ncbi:YdaS family helix-turn-helix protein [Cupriavidus sp. CV2]|uniref:transcriptional regulator n=1 Tax=Cupriavidus ulmosensis TaxID=3065913 RepID=UPI00296B3235|nr:YdaS family helix-turn-helix protein [Cupriavidus sp. CV2]MDW3688867.1 YdaS family helix-turn-helix protein [Cupriavidus sp. CV2]
MDLKTYLSQERGRARKIARAIGAHQPDVSRWISGARPVPIRFGWPIEKATNGEVTRKDLFPKDWQTYWPDLEG